MLSAQSQDGQIAEGMPDSLITARRRRRAWKRSQQEDLPDATEGTDIEDYDLDLDYEGSEPKVEQSAQEQREVDLDAEYPPPEDDSLGTVHGDCADT